MLKVKYIFVIIYSEVIPTLVCLTELSILKIEFYIWTRLTSELNLKKNNSRSFEKFWVIILCSSSLLLYIENIFFSAWRFQVSLSVHKLHDNYFFSLGWFFLTVNFNCGRKFSKCSQHILNKYLDFYQLFIWAYHHSFRQYMFFIVIFF